MGVRLEEGVREGRLSKDSGSSSSGKKYGDKFVKKKEGDANAVSHGRPRRAKHVNNQQYYQPSVSAVTPVVNANPAPVNQNYQNQRAPQQARNQTKVQFDPIPMTYSELYPALVQKSLVQTRSPPAVPEKLPWWYKPDVSCAFHQGAPGHDLDNCYALKYEVQKLIKSGILSFKDANPNVQANPLPKHGVNYVNMVHGCPGEFHIFDIRWVRESLVDMHALLSQYHHISHNYAACRICSRNPRGCYIVKRDLQEMLDQRLIQITRSRDDPDYNVNVVAPHFNIPEPVEIVFDSRKSTVPSLVICPSGPVPYSSDRAVPYKYNATMIEDDKEVAIPSLPSIENIADASRVTRSGRVFAPVDSGKGKESVVVNPVSETTVGQPSGFSQDKIEDEVLKIIKKSDYKVIDQLFQTPSKISILSLLLNSEAHRNSLMRVLEQAYVDHDVTIDQFEGVVGNITACNTLGFSDDELPDEGRNHNLALHISMNCHEDSLSNVLVDTGSSLNVMPKATLDRLIYRGTPMKSSGVIVKAFDGSKKSVIGEVDLPMWIGPHMFQITFQVMDIRPAYSCLLGRPWIHEAGAVTSTLHQRLKFVKNGKLVVVYGEQAMLVSSLSSFRFVDADDSVDGTQFQALSVEDDDAVMNNGVSFASFKAAQRVVQQGPVEGWGQVIDVCKNQNRAGIGFAASFGGSKGSEAVLRPMQQVFHRAGFIHPTHPEVDAVEEDIPEPDGPSFVTRGRTNQNWIAVNVPSVVHISK